MIEYLEPVSNNAEKIFPKTLTKMHGTLSLFLESGMKISGRPLNSPLVWTALPDLATSFPTSQISSQPF